MQKFSRSLIALGGLAALAACGDDVSIQPPPDPVAIVTGVTVSPDLLTLRVGESATLGVSVATTAPSVATSVTWTSSTPAVATVSATGAVTAVAPGNTTVRATSTADATKSGAAQVTVVAPAVQSVTVSPAALSLTVGQSATVVATVTRDAGVAGTVNWASSAPAIATVSAAGVIAAVAPGVAVITATSTVDATKSGAVAVTVSPVPNNLVALSVAPTNASLGIGGSVQLVPSATTVGNPAVSYTYASSNTAVATVSAAGVVTAVGNGTAVITTTATTNTNSLSVATTITVASASVSISSITQNNNPVNIADVSGQFEVTMNISAGNQTLDSVRVLLGGQPGASQVFTVNGAPNAPVTLSINSAAYKINADSSSTVSYLNGSTGVQAQLFVRGATGPTASNTITILLNNSDTFHQRWTLPSNSATSSAGLLWYGGSITLNVIPVNYSGLTTTQATFGLANCSSANVTDTAAPFVSTFTCATTQNASVSALVTTSLYSTGNNGPSAPSFANGTATVRLDNVGPSGSFALTAAAPDNWINASGNWYTFVSGVSDGGVGARDSTTYVFEYEDRAVSGTTWVVNTANPNSVPENAADFTNSAYNERVNLRDRLGNLTIVYLGGGTTPGAQRYGVDVTAPEISYLTTALEPRVVLPATDTLGATKILTNDGNIAGTIRADSAAFGVRYRDTRSGFNTTLNNSQSIRITRLAPSGVTCATGVLSGSPAVCTFATLLGGVDVTDATFRRHVTNNVYGAYVPAVAGDSSGYYTYETFVTDRAGNTSSTISKTVAVDVGPALITGIGVPAVMTGGTSIAFTPTGTDDLEIFDGALGLKYPGMAAAGADTDTLYFPRAFFTDYKSPFSGAPLSNVVGVAGAFGANGLTMPIGFLRGIATVQADSTAALAAGAKPTGVVAQLFDIRSYTAPSSVVYPNLGSAFIGAAILPGLVPAGSTISTLGTGGQWYVFGVNTTGGAIEARARTLTVITNPPFPQVGFFRLTAPGRWVYLGKVDAVPGTNPTIFDQGTDRFWTYRITGVSPAVAAGDQIRAVGMNTAGDGLSTLTCVKGAGC